MSALPARGLSGAAIKREIAAAARSLGFDAVGFGPARTSSRERQELAAYLAEGCHGDMAWLAESAERRAAPQNLWAAAKSVIVLGLNYGPHEDPLAALKRSDRGAISVYAQGRDYHSVIKGRLKQLARTIAAEYQTEVKLFADTAPVMEKPIAARAGVGWQGKHTNLVSREHGSWLFLGEIFTALELPPDAPEANSCGSCRRCLEICPTGAIPAPYRLDSRRCISYLTIEHKGHIPRELRAPIGNRIYGCDDCLAVCPWNKFAHRATELALRPRAELTAPRLVDLAALDDQAFREVFAGTAIKRVGRDRFVRNVLIALGNTGERAVVPVVERRLADSSPLVRAMAVWALSRVADRATFAALKQRYLATETDAAVRVEWGASAHTKSEA
jgi:epoxyqueuosine reductase